MYGLKQSLRTKLSHGASVIQKFGLICAEKDYCVFWQIHNWKKKLLVVYVDDIVIAGDDTYVIDSLNKYL